MAADASGPWRGLRNAAILLLIWEIVGRLDLVAGGALPGISEILIRLWVDWGDYPRHIGATLYASSMGFLIGNALGIGAGVLFALSPTALRLFRGVNIAVFALPPIAIAPILVLTLSGMAPRIALAALGVYFVTMTATVIGLSQADSRATDVIRAYGGTRWDILRRVQFRGALPSILAGLRVAAPNAVLGAILAEFGGGGRWGLGAYLLGSLGRGEPDRLWGHRIGRHADRGPVLWPVRAAGCPHGRVHTRGHAQHRRARCSPPRRAPLGPHRVDLRHDCPAISGLVGLHRGDRRAGPDLENAVGRGRIPVSGPDGRKR